MNYSTLRRSVKMAASTLALLFASGCGSNKSSPTIGGNTVLASNVVVIPSDGTVQASNMTDAGVTLAGAVPPLKPGDIILSPLGSGLLRNVVSTRKSAVVAREGASPQATTDAVDVQTTQAAIEDAVQSCNVPFNHTLAASELVSFEAAIPGATLAANTQTGSAATFHLHTPSADVSGKGTIRAGLEADIDFNINGNLVIQNYAVQQLTVVSDITVKANPSLNASGTASASGDITIGTFTGAPIWLPPPTPAEPIPLLVIRPVYELHATADGTISASMSWAPEITENFSAGFSYSPSAGWESIATATTPTATNVEPMGTFNANLNVTPLNPRASFLFYGVAGPTIWANLPKLNLAGTINTQTNQWSETVSAIFSVEWGLSSPVFKTLNKTVTLASTDPYVLYQASNVPANLPAVYNFTGPALGPVGSDDPVGNPLIGNSVTGTMTLSRALPPNYGGNALPYEFTYSFNFSDGLQEFSWNGNGQPGLDFHTDNQGHIVYWATGYSVGNDEIFIDSPYAGWGEDVAYHGNYRAAGRAGTWSGPTY